MRSVTLLEDFKLGPKTAPPYTLDATVRVIKLDPGKYSLESTVAAHFLQGNAAGVGTATDAAGTASAPVSAVDSQAEMANLAVDVPAESEVAFEVDENDPYLAFCKQSGEADGTLKVNRRDKGRRV